MELLRKKLDGTLTNTEAIAFEKWLEETPENQLLLTVMNFLKENGKEYYDYKNIDADSAWGKVMEKASKEMDAPVRKMNIRRSLSIAASIALLAVVSFLVYSQLSNKNTTSLENFGQPGLQQAYLSIDGQKEIYVAPEKSGSPRTLEGLNVHNETEGGLHYSNPKNTIQTNKAVKHTLRVPRGGEYQVTLSDGTRVWLNAESKLNYPPHFEGDTREVTLEGEAYFEVAKNPDQPFIVKTTQMDIEVLGTAFNVRAYEGEEKVSTTLVEGKVRITENNGKVTPLTPGFQYEVKPESAEFQLKKVNAVAVSGWKDGEFFAEGMELEKILEMVSKWYNIEKCHFKDEEAKNIKFTGLINRNEPLSQWLTFFAQIEPVVFEIENGALTISNK